MKYGDLVVAKGYGRHAMRVGIYLYYTKKYAPGDGDYICGVLINGEVRAVRRSWLRLLEGSQLDPS